MAGWAENRAKAADLIYAEVQATVTQHSLVEQATKNIRADQQTILLTTARDGEVEDLLQLERMFLVQEREHLAGSQAMATSLGNAIEELDIALEVAERVRDPVIYKREIDEAHKRAKNRVGGLPRDEARQFFQSHLARLGNLDKGRMSDSERKVLAARKYNISAAQREYIRLQEQALGIGDEHNQNQGPNPGR